MAVAKMELVNIVGRLKDFDRVVRTCCINGDFHPEQSSQALENIEDFVPIEDSNPYEKSLQRAVDIAVHSDVALEYRKFDKLGFTEEQLRQYVEKAGEEMDTLNGRVNDAAQQSARTRQILTSLDHLQGLGINLDAVFGCRSVVFRFGKLPVDGYLKLTSDPEDEHLFFPIEQDDLYYWGFYADRRSQIQATDEFFTSLYFERIDLVEQAHGTPQAARENLQRLLTRTESDLENARGAVRDYWKENREQFLRVYSNLRYLHDSFDVRRYASKIDDNFYIFGWVTAEEVPVFEKKFAHISNVDCIVEPTEEAGDIQPPTKVVNRRFFRPFELLVGMYGLPDYNEVDPTPFLALTYMLFFGIMFGDLGQGAIIFAAGLFLWLKKKLPLGGIMYRIGIASMIFGTLYNSVFGYEDVLPFTVLPVHRNDPTTTMAMLGITIGLGVLVIVIGMIINVVNGFRQKDPEKSIFSSNGLAGLIFYVSLLALGAMLFLVKGLPKAVVYLMLIFLIVVPLLAMFLKEPLGKLMRHESDWKPKSVGEFIISGFFELFEELLSFLTNTISFVRVGAYILSHAGMMTAFFVLAGLAGGPLQPAIYTLVMIIGNAFVLALEGLVVFIQCIRLEYYEIFGKFYDGGGKVFQPLTIHYGQ